MGKTSGSALIIIILCSLVLVQPVVAAVEGKIAFLSYQNSAGEIYIMNPDGTNQTRLTSNTAYDGEPAWSPDGSKIAFTTYLSGNSDIYTMNPDGSGQTRLTFTTMFDRDPAWSPDGSKIAFVSYRDGNDEIYIMNSDGSDQTRLTSYPAYDREPAWSPDSSKIAFGSWREGNSDICIIKEDGSGLACLTSNTVYDGEPAWSPDGSKIVFASDRDGIYGNRSIYVMNSDGSGQIRLTSNMENNYHPAWSPDGMKIAFTSSRDGNGEIYVMNSDGSGQTRLTSNTVYDEQPDWGVRPQARTVPPILVLPYGYLPSGTPVTAVFTINVAGLYPSDGEELLLTDLDHPNWTYTIVVNGVENLRPVVGGNSLSISGFELSYRSSDVVSTRVTLQGNAPELDSPRTNFTIVKIQSIDRYNDVMPGSVVTIEGQTAATHCPVTDFTNTTPTSGVPPLVVFFWDISTNYPYVWNWSFGDGTWENYTGLVPRNPIHTYSDPGVYTVSLTTTNARGSRTTTKTGFITVRNSTTQIGIFRPSTGYWYLDNNLDGNVDKSFRYGGSTDRIIVLKWQGNTHDSIAIFRPSTGYWYIDYAGEGFVTTSFRYGGSSDRIITGDWQGTRRDGIAIYRPSTGYWYFDYDLNGFVDKSFRYGGSTDQIIAGNWQGSKDGIAIFRPSTGYWYFDYNLDGVVDKSFRYGGIGDRIIAGDWNGDGIDGIAIFRPSTGYWYFDYNLDGNIDKSFRYGGSTDQIIAGDWNGDGSDGIAIFRPSTGYWYFDHNLDGTVDKSFRYGGSTDRIIIGRWATPSWLPQQSITITFTPDLTIVPATTVYIKIGAKVIWKNEDPLKPHGIAAVDSQGAKYFGGLTGIQIPFNKTYEVIFDTFSQWAVFFLKFNPENQWTWHI